MYVSGTERLVGWEEQREKMVKKGRKIAQGYLGIKTYYKDSLKGFKQAKDMLICALERLFWWRIDRRDKVSRQEDHLGG